MTDSEKLARWQGKCYHVSDWGQTICKYCGRTNDPRYFDFDSINPDYLNDDAAAMGLLDTLVEKGFTSRVEYDYEQDQWAAVIFKPVAMGADSVLHIWKSSRREAIIAVCLEVVRKELEAGINA